VIIYTSRCDTAATQKQNKASKQQALRIRTLTTEQNDNLENSLKKFKRVNQSLNISLEMIILNNSNVKRKRNY
jgi:hypothetical protein